MSCGIGVWFISVDEAISKWAILNKPKELRRLTVALIRFMVREGKGLSCLQSVLVEEEGTVSISESSTCAYPTSLLGTVSYFVHA